MSFFAHRFTPPSLPFISVAGSFFLGRIACQKRPEAVLEACIFMQSVPLHTCFLRRILYDHRFFPTATGLSFCPEVALFVPSNPSIPMLFLRGGSPPLSYIFNTKIFPPRVTFPFWKEVERGVKNSWQGCHGSTPYFFCFPFSWSLSLPPRTYCISVIRFDRNHLMPALSDVMPPSVAKSSPWGDFRPVWSRAFLSKGAFVAPMRFIPLLSSAQQSEQDSFLFPIIDGFYSLIRVFFFLEYLSP